MASLSFALSSPPIYRRASVRALITVGTFIDSPSLLTALTFSICICNGEEPLFCVNKVLDVYPYCASLDDISYGRHDFIRCLAKPCHHIHAKREGEKLRDP